MSLSLVSARAATFNVTATTLAISLTAANETVAITAGATNYTFTLNGGTWGGTDSADATGNGTASLAAVKASFTAVTIDDGSMGNGANFNGSGANTYDASSGTCWSPAWAAPAPRVTTKVSCWKPAPPSSPPVTAASPSPATAALITLNGADRVIIDGRFGGSGRYLTFRNTDTGNASSTIRLKLTPDESLRHTS